MRIEISKIPPEGLEIYEQEPPGILTIKDQAVRFNKPVDITITVHIVDEILMIRGRIETEAQIVCSRCAKWFKKSLIEPNFSFNRDVKGLKEVDITDNIREGIIILLPVKPLCRPDCRGLCPKCGQDLNENECGCDKRPENIKRKAFDKLSSRLTN